MSKSKKNNSYLYLAVCLILLVISYFWNPSPVVISTEAERSSPITSTPTVAGVSTTGPVVSGDQWYEIYFTNPVIPFDKVYKGGIDEVLVSKINSAQVSVDVVLYQFDLENVAQALISAKERGVLVRVVYDNQYSDTDPQIGELKASGIVTIPDQREANMHDKFFVFDGQCIWTGSFNITLNAAYRNYEDAIYFCSPEAAKNYATEFEELFGRRFGITSPSDTPYPIFTINGITIENYFAPEDKVLSHILDEVQKATSTIHILAYSFTSNPLGEAFLSEMSEGVQVSAVLETSGASSVDSECGPLLKAGADILLDTNPRILHHKVIIIDSQVVIFGSYNFSDGAETKNDENVLIVHDPMLAQAFEKRFQDIKSVSYKPTGEVCSKK